MTSGSVSKERRKEELEQAQEEAKLAETPIGEIIIRGYANGQVRVDGSITNFFFAINLINTGIKAIIDFHAKQMSDEKQIIQAMPKEVMDAMLKRVH